MCRKIIICENSQKYLESYNEANNARRNRTDKDAKHIFNIGDYALVTYPNRPPHKLAPRYRGPMLIVDQKHPDIFVCRDIITEKDISVHVDRLLEFRHDKPPTDDFVALAAADHDEFAVEAIADHVGSGKKPATYDFKIRWSGDPAEDSSIPWREARDLALNFTLMNTLNLNFYA